MKLIEKVMLVCALNFLVGCATNRSICCGGWLPIYLDNKDVEVISSNLARDILKHNKQRHIYVVGKMVKKRSSKDKDLILHEMIETYQGLKMMSRIMKWLLLIIFVFILDIARLIDALDNIFSHLKQCFSKN